MRRFVLSTLGLLALAAAACGGGSRGNAAGAGASSTGASSSGGGTGAGGGSGSGGSPTTSSSSGGGSSSSSSSGTTGTTGWTVAPLLDDTTDPASTVFRSGNDLVTGIRFASLDDGWVTTAGANESLSNGGAVFKAKHDQVESILFSGNRFGLCLLGSIDFWGLDKSADGYVALAHACDVIASHDGGKTFGIQSGAAGSDIGIEHVLAVRPRAGDTLMVADTYLTAAKTAPGPTAAWTALWAPEAVPPVPNPVPADECQMGPRGDTPTHTTKIDVSADGQRIAYVATPNFDPQVCLSTDGGKTFRPKVLPGVSSDAQPFTPSGVVFADASTGIVFWANKIYPGKGYLYRTTDAGQTWSPVALPSDVAGGAVDLTSAFFAPDGKSGWIVGYDRDSSGPLLARTTDGGATWKRSGGDLASKLAGANGQIFTGFALDAQHIWVGGDHGTFASNASGGE